jgi:type II secretory pathway pseudopilin PulG
MTVCIIMGVLASFTVPRFSRAMEQSRANIAVANLRAIWTAQRAFWLQNVDANGVNMFAPDLATLRNLKLIDQAILDDTGDGSIPQGVSYVYTITQTDSSTFQASARRVNSTVWTSTLAIDSNGDVTGNVQYVGSSNSFGNDPPIDQFFQ